MIIERIRIALIEPHGHAEVLYSLISLLGDFEVMVVTTINCFNELDALGVIDRAKFLTANINCTIQEVILQNFDTINNCHWVIYVTIENEFKFYSKLKFKSKTILIIHSGNFWLNYMRNVHILYFTDFIKFVFALLRCDNHNKCRLLASIDYFNFYTNLNNKYPRGFYPKLRDVLTSKICPNFLFNYPLVNRGLSFKDCNSRINIVVPGNIKASKRDYNLLISAFKRILLPNNIFINVVLLGSPIGNYGKLIQEGFTSLISANIDVICYRNAVPKVEYDKWLEKADFLILPLRKNMIYGFCKEIGGMTKIAGAIIDMERFMVPSLISSEYIYNGVMSNYVIFYKDEIDLAINILQWIINKPPTVNETNFEFDNSWKEFLTKSI